VPAARETLNRLLADYPQSEAAATARERLARLN
jgi:TolA-binding protein